MSLPGFPNVDPPIQREDAVNQTRSSIAMEELGLSHLLNMEEENTSWARCRALPWESSWRR